MPTILCMLGRWASCSGVETKEICNSLFFSVNSAVLLLHRTRITQRQRDDLPDGTASATFPPRVPSYISVPQALSTTARLCAWSSGEGIVETIRQMSNLANLAVLLKKNKTICSVQEAHAKVAGPTLCSSIRGLAPEKSHLLPWRIPWQVRQSGRSLTRDRGFSPDERQPRG